MNLRPAIFSRLGPDAPSLVPPGTQPRIRTLQLPSHPGPAKTSLQSKTWADLQTKALKAERIRYLLHEFRVRDEHDSDELVGAAEASANKIVFTWALPSELFAPTADHLPGLACWFRPSPLPIRSHHVLRKAETTPWAVTGASSALQCLPSLWLYGATLLVCVVPPCTYAWPCAARAWARPVRRWGLCWDCYVRRQQPFWCGSAKWWCSWCSWSYCICIWGGDRAVAPFVPPATLQLPNAMLQPVMFAYYTRYGAWMHTTRECHGLRNAQRIFGLPLDMLFRARPDLRPCMLCGSPIELMLQRIATLPHHPLLAFDLPLGDSDENDEPNEHGPEPEPDGGSWSWAVMLMMMRRGHCRIPISQCPYVCTMNDCLDRLLHSRHQRLMFGWRGLILRTGFVPVICGRAADLPLETAELEFVTFASCRVVFKDTPKLASWKDLLVKWHRHAWSP